MSMCPVGRLQETGLRWHATCNNRGWRLCFYRVCVCVHLCVQPLPPPPPPPPLHVVFAGGCVGWFVGWLVGWLNGGLLHLQPLVCGVVWCGVAWCEMLCLWVYMYVQPLVGWWGSCTQLMFFF